MLKLNKWFGIAGVFLALNVGAAEPAAKSSIDPAAKTAQTKATVAPKPTTSTSPASSEPSAEPVINRTYMQPYNTLASSQPVQSGSKIEVVELFWYGCPHCYHFEPEIKEWLAKLPADVDFIRMPAIPFDRWQPLGQLFYTLEALGEINRLHGDVFDAIHKERLNLEDKKTQLDWVAKKGIDRAKFTEAWNSFSVQSKLKRAAMLSEAYKMEGVPMLVVDGKFTTMGAMDASIFTLNALIEKARHARKSPTATPPKSEVQKKAVVTPAPKPLP